MKTTLKHLAALGLALALALPLTACGGDGERKPADSQSPVAVATPAPTATPKPADPYDAVRTYWSEDQLTQAWGPEQPVEHLFFHPIIAYPQWAFHDCSATQSEKEGLDDWMVTVDEFNKIIQSVYDKGFILVAMEDVWSEVTGEDGVARMQRNTLMLPEGKKPLVISFDDVNYYEYMLEQGFTSKLVLGDDGQIWAECTDPYTKQTFLTQDLDATTLLDQFVLAHPDFSLNGAKAIFSLTGYQGILGYRTQNDIDIAADDPARPAFDANRAAEIEAVKPILQRLKETGWTFGSHTWGPWKRSSGTPSAGRRRWALWWDPPISSFIPTAPGPTETIGTPPVLCSSTSRIRASGSSPAWASIPSPMSKRISPPSSATGCIRTEPRCGAATPARMWSAICPSTTAARSLTWRYVPIWAYVGLRQEALGPAFGRAQ